MPDQHLEDLLARLERERLDADRLYNDALTALDRAIQSVPALPASPPVFDATRLTDLNAGWNLLPDGPPAVDRSLKGRLRAFVWRLVGPPLQTQTRFNASLVDHLNRNAPGDEERPRALARLLDAVRREFEALVRFESLLVQYLQTITIYVDSKDRSLGGPELLQRLRLAEQRILALKRDLEARADGGLGSSPARPAADRPSGAVDSVTYVEFEDRFRGSRDEVRSRVEEYVPLLAACSDVVDIGCGRGELLDLLKARGVTARGVDGNAAMVERCRARGLDVEHADALAYLARVPEGSLGALVAIQVVEHFDPPYLARFLETAFHTLRPGAPIILETINPACWMAFFETYIRDLTHRRPLHPDTLRYLVEASGFSRVELQYRRPVGELERLARVDGVASSAAGPAALAHVINDHADKLNARLFSSMDYVIVARR